MQEVIKAAVIRQFPELSGGLHLDRYGRVVAVPDAPTQGASCERFRPRYAVDVQILTPDLEPDPDFPVYPAIPLPVPLGAGQESGTYAFPEPGTLVVVGFAYGRPDHPIIRQVYPLGASLPQIAPREWLAQQSPAVFQRADAEGNWTRRTDAAIEDDSLTRLVKAVEAVTEVAREVGRVSEHSTLEVEGMRTVEVGTMLTMLAGLRADLGSLGALNLTAGSDSTWTTAGASTETVGQDHASTIGGDRTITVQGGRAEQIHGDQALHVGGGRTVSVTGDSAQTITGASTETVSGNKTTQAANILFQAGGTLSLRGAGINLFGELLACLDEIRAALEVLASHTHPDIPIITEGATVAGHAAQLGQHRDNIGGVTA